MRFVITGATGAIGHALIEKCIENNDEVLVIRHRNSKRNNSLPNDPLVKTIDINSDEYLSFGESYDGSFGKYDVFYHLAWSFTFGEGRNNTDQQCLNIKYSLDAVKLANTLGCKVFVGAGSQAEYGRVEGPLKSNTPANPENGYGIAKLCAGQMTRLLCNQLEIKHIWTRILSVYGPYDGENSLVVSSLRKMLKNEDVLATKGEQIWDFIYSSDAANIMYLLSSKGLDGKTYVIGSGKTSTIKDYLLKMKEISSSKSIIRYGSVPYSDKQVMHLCADIEELVNDVGYEPSVSFDDGIRKTIEYIRGRN